MALHKPNSHIMCIKAKKTKKTNMVFNKNSRYIYHHDPLDKIKYIFLSLK